MVKKQLIYTHWRQTSISWAPSSSFLVIEGVMSTIGRSMYFTVGFFDFDSVGLAVAADSYISCNSENK